jgi:hypothetical protein
MYYLIIGAVLVLSTVLLLVAGISFGARGSSAQPRVGPRPLTAQAQKAPTPRGELEQRLKALSESQGPPPNHQGASCYAPRALPERADYVCPKDGTKTQYGYQQAELVRNELPGMRTILKEIEALKPAFTVKLEESEFCKKCSPKVKEPAATLVVGYPDAQGGKLIEVRTRGVGVTDLRIIQEFLAGSDKHQAGGPDTVPLKTFVPRLRELLGFTPQPPAAPAPKP